MILRLCLLSFACVLTVAAQNASPTANDGVVRYHATIDNVKYVYGVAPAVANVKPGNILEANSLDCFGNVLQKPGDSFALIKGDNPLTGPFFVDGAEPGDTLVVHFRMNGDWVFDRAGDPLPAYESSSASTASRSRAIPA